ncbi:MAG: hypothetical protein RL522_1026 [Pseudomonadota bacterium]|jgi:hypothetical protein
MRSLGFRAPFAGLALALAVNVHAQDSVSAPAPSAPSAPLASSPASAGRWVGGLDFRAEKARIDRERASAKARQVEEEAECRKRFAVTDCLDRTRRKWQPVLADLRRQEIALNDADRKQRGAEQQGQLDEKVSPQAQEEAEQRRAQALADYEARQARAAAKASGPAPGGKPRDPQAGAERSGPAVTSEEAQANAQAHARRVQEAQERKERALKRQAERAKPAASALPVPQ